MKDRNELVVEARHNREDFMACRASALAMFFHEGILHGSDGAEYLRRALTFEWHARECARFVQKVPSIRYDADVESAFEKLGTESAECAAFVEERLALYAQSQEREAAVAARRASGGDDPKRRTRGALLPEAGQSTGWSTAPSDEFAILPGDLVAVDLATMTALPVEPSASSQADASPPRCRLGCEATEHSECGWVVAHPPRCLGCESDSVLPDAHTSECLASKGLLDRKWLDALAEEARRIRDCVARLRAGCSASGFRSTRGELAPGRYRRIEVSADPSSRGYNAYFRRRNSGNVELTICLGVPEAGYWGPGKGTWNSDAPHRDLVVLDSDVVIWESAVPIEVRAYGRAVTVSDDLCGHCGNRYDSTHGCQTCVARKGPFEAGASFTLVSTWTG